MKPCNHDSYPLYKQLIGPFRELAKELGYAIAVHGTLKRDIDLLACPWTPAAVPPRILALSLRELAEQLFGRADLSWHLNQTPEFTLQGGPGVKPHGRLGWCFSLGNGPSYVDLSIMPPE